MFPISLSGIRFTPGGRSVLAGVDLDIDGEGITALIGPNGAGSVGAQLRCANKAP